MVIRAALVVWEERAKFCDEQAGWRLAPMLAPISSRLEELDAKHFPAQP